ncbi:MAG: sulfite exporter TauE/SafE family protein, partial [Dechloromonas sp.]
MIDWTILAPAAFFAGMVDAVVGGGGLIQIPVLLAQFPQTSIPTLFGTNKLSSIAGTGAALWRYARSVRIPWLVVLPATVAALLGAWGGAALVAWLPRETMRPLVVVMMIAVALYTFLRKDLGQQVTRVLDGTDRWRGALFGLVIGAYDGFFGPGTGSFLIFGFVRLFGMDFV